MVHKEKEICPDFTKLTWYLLTSAPVAQPVTMYLWPVVYSGEKWHLIRVCRTECPLYVITDESPWSRLFRDTTKNISWSTVFSLNTKLLFWRWSQLTLSRDFPLVTYSGIQYITVELFTFSLNDMLVNQF